MTFGAERRPERLASEVSISRGRLHIVRDFGRGGTLDALALEEFSS